MNLVWQSRIHMYVMCVVAEEEKKRRSFAYGILDFFIHFSMSFVFLWSGLGLGSRFSSIRSGVPVIYSRSLLRNVNSILFRQCSPQKMFPLSSIPLRNRSRWNPPLRIEESRPPKLWIIPLSELPNGIESRLIPISPSGHTSYSSTISLTWVKPSMLANGTVKQKSTVTVGTGFFRVSHYIMAEQKVEASRSSLVLPSSSHLLSS
jgi:hypothetical protein